jgi:hypothetical protein
MKAVARTILLYFLVRVIVVLVTIKRFSNRSEEFTALFLDRMTRLLLVYLKLLLRECYRVVAWGCYF